MKSFLDYLNEEKLKGNQVKLDINKNGKLDKFDFMALQNKNKIKKEYVNDQGKLIEKPEVAAVADYKGPDAKTPPGDKKAAPYKAANDNVKSPTFDVEKNGLGELGDNKLKYEPNTEYKQELVKSSWTTKTESFLNKTKNMSLSEFTKYMLDECGCGSVQSGDLPYVTAYTTGKFQPHPPEAVKYVVVLANKNDNVLDNVVHEMKASGMLGKLMKALLDNPEAYDELTSLLGDSQQGPGRCKLFAKSMNNSLEKFMSDQDSMYESVSSPVGFDTEDDEEIGIDDYKKMHGEEEDEDDYADDEEDMEDEDDYADDEEDMEDEDDYADDEEDMEDEDDYADDEEDMDMGDEENDMDMGDEEPHNAGDEMDPSAELPRKLKKKFAHNHLLDAMRGFDSIKNSIE
jgi:hypothetical protein